MKVKNKSNESISPLFQTKQEDALFITSELRKSDVLWESFAGKEVRRFFPEEYDTDKKWDNWYVYGISDEKEIHTLHWTIGGQNVDVSGIYTVYIIRNRPPASISLNNKEVDIAEDVRRVGIVRFPVLKEKPKNGEPPVLILDIGENGLLKTNEGAEALDFGKYMPLTINCIAMPTWRLNILEVKQQDLFTLHNKYPKISSKVWAKECSDYLENISKERSRLFVEGPIKEIKKLENYWETYEKMLLWEKNPEFTVKNNDELEKIFSIEM